MTRTVLLNCPIKAAIRAVESQSDFSHIVIVMIMMIIILKLKKKNSNDNYSKNSNNGKNDA